MKRWSIKGASIAVMKDNRLVYTQGYGFASREDKEEMKTYHMMRIASASKLITAIGIMKLYEEGLLSLEDKVFGKQGILGEYKYIKDEKHLDITVKDLLNHRGGWSWRDGDFMFQPMRIKNSMKLDGPPSQDDIIEFVLQKRRLRYKPGTQYSYSNFGYMLLGKIIEKKTTYSYEQYIVEEVLEPYGIYGMTLSGNYLWDRKDFEARYYDHPSAYKYGSFDGSFLSVSKPYGGNDIKTLGAAGAWIANASQLAKIMALIDPESKGKKMLSERSIELMTQDEEYLAAFGWKGVNGENWWRTGTLSGSSCYMKRADNGFSYVVILNSSVWMGHRFHAYTRQFMDKNLDLINTDESIDLFWQDKASPSILPII